MLATQASLKDQLYSLERKSNNDLDCLFSCLQAISDDDDSCLINRGIAYTMLGELDNAMEDFNKACKLFAMSMMISNYKFQP